MKQRRPEELLQQACLSWYNLQYSHVQGYLFHIPNGGKRSRSEAAAFKRIGVRSGIPDLFLSIGKPGVANGLYIEMKAGKGKPTENQTKAHECLESAGFWVRIIYSLEEFMALITMYLEDVDMAQLKDFNMAKNSAHISIPKAKYKANRKVSLR